VICIDISTSFEKRGLRLLERNVDMVGRLEEVRVPPSAPAQFLKGFLFAAEVPFSLKMTKVAEKWLAG